MRRAVAAAIVILLVGAGLLVWLAPGGDSICTDTERLFEGGGIHVLPGVEVTYEFSPPTSGAHELPAPGGGAVTAPVAEPRQVTFIETGGVIVNYDPSLPQADIDALEALGAEQVLVTPAVRPLDGEALVAHTAWAHRQLCDGADVDAAETFIALHLNQYFVNHE